MDEIKDSLFHIENKVRYLIQTTMIDHGIIVVLLAANLFLTATIAIILLYR